VQAIFCALAVVLRDVQRAFAGREIAPRRRATRQESCALDEATPDGILNLEHHQLELCYADLRVRRTGLEARLLASLERDGQQLPVVAVPAPSGRYRVIDGYKRIRALRRLGVDVVRTVVWGMSDGDALLLARGLRTAPAETALEQGWLLSQLRRLGLSAAELARRLSRNASWVSRRLALVDVPKNL